MSNLWKKCLWVLCAFVLLFTAPEKTFADATITQATATALSSSKIELKWNRVEGAAKYRIYRSTSKDSGFQKLATLSASTVSYRDTGVKAAVSYYYRIVPISAETKEEMTEKQQTIRGKTPAKTVITRLTVKAPTKIKVSWNIAKGANGYQVYRSNSMSGDYTKIADIKGADTLNYTDKTVTPGKTYYYKIRSTYTSGGNTGVGSFCDPIKGKTIAKTSLTSITSVNSQTMRITWKKVSGAKNYEVYRSTTANGSFKKIATVNSSTTKYTDKTVKTGKKYYYKVVSVGSLNGKKITGGYSDPISYRSLSQPKISSIKTTENDTLKINWKKITGATKYKVYRATSKNGTYKKVATVQATAKNTQFYIDSTIKSGKTYYYKVQAYSSNDGVISAGKGNISEIKSGCTGYAIMGETTVTADQMVALFNSSGRKYPSSVYKNKGAKNLKKFCEIVIDESEKEGVRAEVIFAQVCLETGYLQFGGQVSAEQCNFAGLGATDDGAAGATFSSVRIGIRAQVQHLKGYASKDNLNQECVDPRFMYLTYRRGTAKYVQDLGNGNWATDPNYSFKLMNLIKAMKSY